MNCFNNIVAGINSVGHRYQKMHEGADPEEFFWGDGVPRGLQMTDVSFNVIVGYLQDISKRAIELHDPELLELLKGMNCVKDEEEAPEKETPAQDVSHQQPDHGGGNRPSGG